MRKLSAPGLPNSIQSYEGDSSLVPIISAGVIRVGSLKTRERKARSMRNEGEENQHNLQAFTAAQNKNYQLQSLQQTTVSSAQSHRRDAVPWYDASAETPRHQTLTNHYLNRSAATTGQSSITHGHYCRGVLDDKTTTSRMCDVVWNVDVQFCIENTLQASSVESDKLRHRWPRYEPKLYPVDILPSRSKLLAEKYQDHFVLQSYSIIQANITFDLQTNAWSWGSVRIQLLFCIILYFMISAWVLNIKNLLFSLESNLQKSSL